MHTTHWKHLMSAGLALLAAGAALVWSWNTLATLFGAPVAEFKHALAVVLIVSVARGVIGIGKRRRLRSTRGGHPS